jgi:hypothetical protein
MNKLKLIKIAAVLFVLFVCVVQVAPVALAASPQSVLPSGTNPGLPGNPSIDLPTEITNIIRNILLPIAGIIAVLFIVIGGYQYMFSAGNDEMAESGKKTLQNAIIGLVIIILSYLIISVIVNTIFKVTN